MKRLFLIVILFVASSSYAPFFKDLEFKAMKNFDMKKRNDKMVIGFDYVIYNPNWYNIVIKESSLKLTVANQDCGWAHVDNKIKIKKKSEAPYHFELVGDAEKFAKSTFTGVWDFITGKGIAFNIKGDVKAGAFLIRAKWAVDYTYTMDFEEFMSFF
jgi:LEA14-like dessication related protein